MGKAFIIIGAIAAAIYWYNLPRYRAEVGYFDGGVEHWWFGTDTAREDCTREARGFYNNLNLRKPGTAFSWACLVVKGDRVITRVR